MEWVELKNQEDILYLQEKFGNFEDSVLVYYHFNSGNYIDDNLVGYENNTNNFTMIFQRMDKNPFSIEILFENLRRFNFIAPNWNDNYSSEILYAKIVKNDKYYYWTKWEEFDPYNEQHLTYNDFILVEAHKVKWRIIKD